MLQWAKLWPDEQGSHEAVSACAVIEVPNKTYTQGMLPLAVVVLKKDYVGQEPTVQKELETLCSIELAEYARPSEYVFRDSLSFTTVGKVDYRALEWEAER